MRRVGVAVGEFQHVLRAAAFHEGVVDVLLGHHATQGHGAIGDLLGHIQDVWRHAECGRAGVSAQTAEAGDHFIKNQQDVVGRANLTQALQIAHWRNHHAA